MCNSVECTFQENKQSSSKGLSMQWLILLSCSLFSLIHVELLVATETSSSYVVAAYYENYSGHLTPTENRPAFAPAMIDPNILTDIYFAFASFGYISKAVDPTNPHLTGDYTIQPTEKNDQTELYPQIMALKKRSKNGLRIFLSIGGWNFNDPQDKEGVGDKTYRLFSQMVAVSANRKQFIDSAIEYAHKYGFDGIDIDWEYPGDLKRGGTPDDFNHFLTFLQECSKAFNETTPPLLLSIATPATVPSNLPSRFHDEPSTFFKWLAQCAQYVDRLNIMTYDYHGPFDVPKITGVNTPLYRDTNPKSSNYIAKTLQNYLENGVPAKKIVMGLATFGHSYAGVAELSLQSHGPGKPFETGGSPGLSTNQVGFLSYFEIIDMLTQKKIIGSLDKTTMTAQGYDLPTKFWVSYDNPDTIKEKARMALKQNLKGVMFWSVNMDEYHKELKYPNIYSAWKIFYPPR